MRSFAFAIPLAVIAAAPAVAAEMAADTRVAAVTVFPDRALVTRTARVALPAGSHTLVVEGLPAGLLAQSLRVTGSGAPGTAIGSVESRVISRQELVRDEERRLQALVTDLRDRRRVVEAQMEALRLRHSFIERLTMEAGEAASDDLTRGVCEPERWEKAWITLQSGAELALRGIVDLERDLRGIDEAIAKAEADLAAVRTGDRASAEVRVNVEAPADGTLDLAIAYQVPGASWRPVYDLRLDSRTGRMALVQYGTVSQHTGEDWTGVDLTLSTARPGEGAAMPRLGTWWIAPQPVPTAEAASMPRTTAAPAPLAAEMAKGDAVARMREAEVVASDFAAEYRIPGASSVPADRARHRFAIASHDLPAALSARVVPKLAAKAWLQAEVTYDGPAPLLPGEAALFRDGTFIGSSRLALLRPGDKAGLDFGVDDRVAVEFLPQKDEGGDKGILSSDRRIERRFKTKLTNLHQRPLEVVVYDQVPVSRDQEIKVEVIESATTPGFVMDADDRPGVLAWKRVAEPGEKVEVDFAYAVTFPPEKKPAGL